MKRICLVFNHNQPFAVLGREQFEAALEQEMTFELPHAGDAAYKAANRGEPLVLSNGNSAYSKAVERFMRMVVPAEPKTAQKRRLSLIGRPSAPRTSTARPSSGLLGALRGKRAS